MSTRASSIREVAAYAGVAPSTASRILNKSATAVPVKQETRLRVLEACRKLNYHPNVHARRLFSRRSDVIAVVVPRREHMPSGWYDEPALGKILDGIAEVAGEKGKDILLVPADTAFFEKRKYIELFRSRSIDAMLIFGAMWSDDYIHELYREGWPLVLLGTHLEDESIPHVVSDDARGSTWLAEHLIDLGHRRLAYLTGLNWASAGIKRHRAFCDTCKAGGVELAVLNGDFGYESGYQLGLTLLSGPARPTGIAAANDTMALGVIAAASSRGLQVPRDLSVVGADGSFPHYRPLLTTCEMPFVEVGSVGARFILEQLEGKGNWLEFGRKANCVLRPRFVIGETTARPYCVE